MVVDKPKEAKRKLPDQDQVEASISTREAEEADEDDDFESGNDNLFGNIENGNDEDSSDSEGDEFHEGDDDDDDVLSFESFGSDDDDDDAEEEEKLALGKQLKSRQADDQEESDSADDVNSDSSPEEDDDGKEDLPDDSEEEKEPKEAPVTAEEAARKALLDEEPKLQEIEKVLGTRGKKTRGVGVFPELPDSDGEKVDEYADGDTSDEEDIRNTVGNIPMHWYDEYKHVGYDWDAKRIIKPRKGDAIDDFLQRMEDPNFWRTVRDPQTGQRVVLSDEDIELIKRINSGRNPDVEYDDYEPWIEWFTSEVEQTPIRNIPDSKQSFLPCKIEQAKIRKYVKALKMGWLKTREEQERLKAEKKAPKYFMLWDTDHGREQMRRIHDHVTAPKRPLPHHAESYNPPPEYLFNEREMAEWERNENEPWKRKLHFVPQKYDNLRSVPAYPKYLKERFIRCLDLYLCPRGKRSRVTVGPEYLVPKLPSPRDLQPFPTLQNLIYKGHTDMIRTISVEPKGEYIVTGSDDHTVKIWEISTARCIHTIPTGDIVRSVAWCPNAKISLIAVASGNRVLLINPKVGDSLLVKKTDDLLTEAPRSDTIDNERVQSAVQWTDVTDDERKEGVRLVITHFRIVKQVVWHGRGDYFATVMPEAAHRSVLIHQLSKRRSQLPFSKSKGLVQCVLFHPVKPCLFVATQRHVRVYDLVKQVLVKKLFPTCKWISSMAIHPKGDNLVIGTYEKKLMWFDLDLSTKPYQQLRIHNAAVRNVAFHLRYPLFASSSDDRSVIVSHGMVYSDLLQNPLIVPLRRLQDHDRLNDFSVFDVVFHPTQPWLFSTGADHTVRLYT